MDGYRHGTKFLVFELKASVKSVATLPHMPVQTAPAVFPNVH